LLEITGKQSFKAVFIFQIVPIFCLSLAPHSEQNLNFSKIFLIFGSLARDSGQVDTPNIVPNSSLNLALVHGWPASPIPFPLVSIHCLSSVEQSEPISAFSSLGALA
jgi:hypothetical protein